MTGVVRRQKDERIGFDRKPKVAPPDRMGIPHPPSAAISEFCHFFAGEPFQYVLSSFFAPDLSNNREGAEILPLLFTPVSVVVVVVSFVLGLEFSERLSAIFQFEEIISNAAPAADGEYIVGIHRVVQVSLFPIQIKTMLAAQSHDLDVEPRTFDFMFEREGRVVFDEFLWVGPRTVFKSPKNSLPAKPACQR